MRDYTICTRNISLIIKSRGGLLALATGNHDYLIIKYKINCKILTLIYVKNMHADFKIFVNIGAFVWYKRYPKKKIENV